MNKQVPTSYLPRNFNRKNVMNETNGSRYDCKYVNDESYMSKICIPINNAYEVEEDGKYFNKQYVLNNPQNAYFDNGKYCFDFPSIWFNANSVNKAIGLRSIDIFIKPLLISWGVVLQSGGQTYTRMFYINASTFMGTEDICSQIAFLVNQWISESWRDRFIVCLYSYNFGEVKIGVETDDENFDFSLYPGNDDFSSLFGKLPEPVKSTRTVEQLTTYSSTYIFQNVWNRRDAYIHASFVNYTSFNYLGKNGEFYSKISKIYDFNVGTSNNFYFQLSLDGIHLLDKPERLGIDFHVGLCFIVDDKKYNGE